MQVSYDTFKSTQLGPAQNLVTIVKRHLASPFLRPIPSHQHEAFERLHNFVSQERRPIIIDSCCGTGLSTAKLAELYPQHFVIGLDKSLKRLSRSTPSASSNYMLLRSDVIDLWRLLRASDLPISHHFLFFPNPWPKKMQLKRRFHAHPIFSTMATLAPYFEMRTNWRLYAEECQLALGVLGKSASIALKEDKKYFTLFEKKYLESSCNIFILTTGESML